MGQRSKQTRFGFGKPGRKQAIASGLPTDPIDRLLSIGRLAIPDKKNRKRLNIEDQFDFLDEISTKDKRRLAGAQLTTSKLLAGSSATGGGFVGFLPDQLQMEMINSGVPGAEDMGADGAARWYFREALAGLDERRKVREHPAYRKNLKRFKSSDSVYKATFEQMGKDEQEAAELLRYADEKYDFLASSSDEYRENFRAQVFSDDNFVGSNSYEYDLAKRMRSEASVASGVYDEANEASFRLAEEIEAGRRPIPSPLTFKMSGTQGEGLVSAYDTSLKVGQPAFIVDIDETLLTGTKKAKKIEDRILSLKSQRQVLSSEWYPWNQAAKQAKPIKPMIDFVKSLEEAGIQPVFMTARDEAMREFTTERLRKLGLDPKHLYMRGLDQAQQDMSPNVLKSSMIDDIGKRFNFIGAMDDSGSVVEMAFKRGISFGMVPPKGGFDSIEASIERGLEVARKVSDEAVGRMNQSIEPVVTASARSGKMSMGTLERIIANRRLGEAVVKKAL